MPARRRGPIYAKVTYKLRPELGDSQVSADAKAASAEEGSSAGNGDSPNSPGDTPQSHDSDAESYHDSDDPMDEGSVHDGGNPLTRPLRRGSESTGQRPRTTARRGNARTTQPKAQASAGTLPMATDSGNEADGDDSDHSTQSRRPARYNLRSRNIPPARTSDTAKPD